MHKRRDGYGADLSDRNRIAFFLPRLLAFPSRHLSSMMKPSFLVIIIHQDEESFPGVVSH